MYPEKVDQIYDSDTTENTSDSADQESKRSEYHQQIEELYMAMHIDTAEEGAYFVEELKKSEGMVVYALSDPDHYETLLLALNFLEKLDQLAYWEPSISKELEESRVRILVDSAEALKRYAADDKDMAGVHALNFGETRIFSENTEEAGVALEILKAGAASGDPYSTLHSIHRIMSEPNIQFYDPGFRPVSLKLAEIVKTNTNYVKALIEDDSLLKRKLGIGICLDCAELGGENWTDTILKGHEAEALEYVLDRVRFERRVPEWYTKTIGSYFSQENTPDGISAKFDDFLNSLLMDQDLLGKGLEYFSECIVLEDPDSSFFGHYVINKYLENFQLGDMTDKYLTSWIQGCEGGMLSHIISLNLKHIYGLEKASEGITGRLTKEFGIHHFGRYPAEILLAQDMQYEKKDTPYGVMLLAGADHNGTFYQHSHVYANVYEHLKFFSEKLRTPYAFRVYEENSRKGILRRLKKVTDTYGEMSFAILGAHGDRFSMEFGLPGSEGNVHSGHLQSIDPERHEFFTDNATIILMSCLTGEEGDSTDTEGMSKNIAEDYSRAFGVKVIAPQHEIYVENINPRLTNNGLEFSVEYSKGVNSIYHVQKKRS